MKYPDPFLKYYYETFPELLTEVEVVPLETVAQVVAHPENTQVSKFPNLKIHENPPVVYTCFAVIYDVLVTMGLKSGS